MENKEFETNKKSYNRKPDEQRVKKFDETNHVNVQKENIEDDLLLQSEKKSFNRLPNERDDQQMENYNELSHVQGNVDNSDEKNLAETEKKSHNRLPDEPVTERSVQEQYKSDTKDSKSNK